MHKIYIPSLSGFFANSFHYNFCNSFSSDKYEVCTEIEHVENDSIEFSIIILCWPELLIQYFEIKGKDFISLLQTNHSNSKIGLFVHNEKPHNNGSQIESLCKNIEIKFLMYLGIRKINEFEKKNFKISNLKRIILRHPLYGPFPYQDSTVRLEVASIIGSIRNFEEFQIFLQGYSFFKKIKINVNTMCKFSFRPKTNYFFEKLLLKILSAFLNFYFTNFFKPPYLSDEKIAYQLLKSKFLFVPRNEILNSGSAIFGLSCGCCVIGPEYGNVGLLLKRSKNETFPINPSKKQIKQSILNAVKKTKKKQIHKENIKFSQKILSWNKFREKLNQIEKI